MLRQSFRLSKRFPLLRAATRTRPLFRPGRPYCVVPTSSPNPIPATLAPGPIVFNSSDSKTWYKTTVPLQEPWSCDWDNWHDIKLFLDPDGPLSPRVFWRIPGEIQPLAFVPHWIAPQPTYLFVADGVHYRFSYGELDRIDGPFNSPDDFLRRLADDKDTGWRETEILPISEEEIVAGLCDADARTIMIP
ncbi:hypothetical protein B0H16DRAFT_1763399 [Mycena metata]|uniref:Uncharacterized protein n=1 Tax=Mycena metata TaxID=1033252 RepID=A0AAD7JZL4_9AGAR|nr:hypothetical protein B0H16DRAFT_1763399 [Mycena metata]